MREWFYFSSYLNYGVVAVKTENTVRLSSKGQLVIPRAIRETLNWDPGVELTVVPTSQGVMIRRKRQQTGKRFVDLIGSVPYDGPPLSDKELQAPVDYADDWEASGKPQR